MPRCSLRTLLIHWYFKLIQKNILFCLSSPPYLNTFICFFLRVMFTKHCCSSNGYLFRLKSHKNLALKNRSIKFKIYMCVFAFMKKVAGSLMMQWIVVKNHLITVLHCRGLVSPLYKYSTTISLFQSKICGSTKMFLATEISGSTLT